VCVQVNQNTQKTTKSYNLKFESLNERNIYIVFCLNYLFLFLVQIYKNGRTHIHSATYQRASLWKKKREDVVRGNFKLSRKYQRVHTGANYIMGVVGGGGDIILSEIELFLVWHFVISRVFFGMTLVCIIQNEFHGSIKILWFSFSRNKN